MKIRTSLQIFLIPLIVLIVILLIPWVVPLIDNSINHYWNWVAEIAK